MRTCSVQELHAALEKSATIVLDVREPNEFAAGHIPGSVNVAEELSEEIKKEISGKAVYVVCSVGARSWRLMQAWAAEGVDVINVWGGLTGWRLAGYPIAKLNTAQ